MYFIEYKTPEKTQVEFRRKRESALKSIYDTKQLLEKTKSDNISGRLDEFHNRCSELILEVGRKCNLKCDHCLRGDAENVTMPIEVAKLAIDQFDYISSITFTGGEPALYGKEISDIVEYIIDSDAEVGSFYIATNGTVLSWQLINALMRLYDYCEDKEFCLLDISDDHFHQADVGYSDINYGIYRTLVFSRFRGDVSEVSLINEGRAKENGYGGRLLKKYPFEYEEVGDAICAELVYVNAHGGILPDCDLSYKTQEEMKPYTIYDIKNGKITMQDIIKTFNREE